MGQQIVMDLLAIHATNLTRRMPPRLQKPRRGCRLHRSCAPSNTLDKSMALMRTESIGL